MRCMADVKTKRVQTSHLPISVYNAKGGGVRLRTLSKGTPPALAVTHSLGYIVDYIHDAGDTGTKHT